MAEDSTTEPSAAGEVAVLRDGAVATSSTRIRRWRRDGAELHHLIDPRSGRPAVGPWRTATVIAASCVDANIAATAAILLGVEARAWLAAAGLPARLVATDGEIVRIGEWSHEAALDRAPGRPAASSRVRQPGASRLASTSPTD
jgi:thiamine biosynthesis lipoprotein